MSGERVKKVSLHIFCRRRLDQFFGEHLLTFFNGAACRPPPAKDRTANTETGVRGSVVVVCSMSACELSPEQRQKLVCCKKANSAFSLTTDATAAADDELDHNNHYNCRS